MNNKINDNSNNYSNTINSNSNNNNCDNNLSNWEKIGKRINENTYILKIAYDGNNEGFQSNPYKKNNVCDTIIDALLKCGYMEKWETKPLLRGGRTDNGVLALGNFIIVNLNQEPILSHIYSKLKYTGVWVVGYSKITELPEIKYRHYRYILPNEGQNINLMVEGANKLIGTHSFHNLSKRDNTKNKNPLRTIYDIKIKENDFFITIDIIGKNFLWNMVRRIITALSEVGKENKPLNWIDKLLDTSHTEGIAPAPANGLILVDVKTNINYIRDDYVIGKFKEEWRKNYRKNTADAGVSMNMLNEFKA